MQNVILYSLTFILMILSFTKDKKKTKMALKKAWKAFDNILPQMLGIITLVGIMLGILNPQMISSLIGSSSGWLGVILATSVGAITLIPGFIAFPTAAMLLDNGAGYMQIGGFVSSLMMVGLVTTPVEIQYFGKKATIIRNIAAFVFSFAVALLIGKVVGR
ncbi:uncharacterized membrane protein YraQ (UPF0718 family) [Acetoanaerobium pronyense]|uniref:Uncharacterized membrane protein YraQ (UPF0718 family) n=1 Tax=Acetoanaerobium pronyense TaxID=1482736 RepID=A0ABS4KLN6_9FIRM|nr:permease [Acetoanaerobium pronyense]MBP2027529.1 uncharacterized membrane protein YraQ (UPF0718 family) [Acetoanaerobium pronyense]